MRNVYKVAGLIYFYQILSARELDIFGMEMEEGSIAVNLARTQSRISLTNYTGI